MSRIACFILSYEITKGMKSFGPIGLLKSGGFNRELILCQIHNLKNLFTKTDISIISGFGGDKLHKKIPSDIKIITNYEFDTKNQGHALKLILANYELDKYDGIFIINSGTLIRNLSPHKNISTKKSWILSKSIRKSQQNTKFLGARTDSKGQVDYIFYDIGDYAWCDSVYICNREIDLIKNNISSYYDNMFLFEVINKSITNDARYEQVVVSHDSVINIIGMKDKHKIKD
jgi:hypothetical protein